MAFNIGTGSNGSIASSTDVALANTPSQGHILSYNTGVQKWVNTNPPVATVYTAVIFYNTATQSWPTRASVGSPLTVEWRGPAANRPLINSTYAKTGYDTFYAIS